MKIHLPPFIREFASVFSSNGFELYLVGGAVRNIALSTAPKDWDFATNAAPSQIMNMFRRVIPTGIEHGTVTVLFKSRSYEVTTYRIDGTYSDNRRPDAVVFSSSIYEDLKRRDFTINAMAVNTVNGQFLDPHGGRNDIKHRLIQTVGDAHTRFDEDALRIMRAVRFSCQLGFSLSEATLHSMRELAPRVRSVSAERFRDEFVKMLTSPYSENGLSLGVRLGILGTWVPEINACIDFKQSEDDPDLLSHLIRASSRLKETGNSALILAGFLHDIAKPQCILADQETGNVHFPSHDEIGADTAETILRRLKFPSKTISTVSALIREHMFDHHIAGNPKAVRRLIARVGREMVMPLLFLRQADILAYPGRDQKNLVLIHRLISEVQAELENTESALHVSDLAINGDVLIEELGIPRGKIIGSILTELLDTVLDDPSANRPEHLKMLARSIYANRWEFFRRN